MEEGKKIYKQFQLSNNSTTLNLLKEGIAMRKSWLLRTLLFCTVIFFMVACCQENSDCPPDSYCIKAPGDCGGEGVCIEKKSVPPSETKTTG